MVVVGGLGPPLDPRFVCCCITFTVDRSFRKSRYVFNGSPMVLMLDTSRPSFGPEEEAAGRRDEVMEGDDGEVGNGDSSVEGNKGKGFIDASNR